MLGVRTFWKVSHKKYGWINSVPAPGLSYSLDELAHPGDIYQEDKKTEAVKRKEVPD